jgi:hypothetical protein
MKKLFNRQKRATQILNWKNISEELLEEKVKGAVAIVYDNSKEMANIFKDEIFLKHKSFELFLESVFLNLHFFDRLAFQYIGSDNRNIFMNDLYTETSCSIVEIIANPDTIALDDAMVTFYQMYQNRQKVYANCDIIPEKNNIGGFNIKNTVGWKLAEGLSGEDAIFYGVQANIVISRYFLAIAKFLKEENFFKQ